MAAIDLKWIAGKMRKIDLCMMVTRSSRGELNSRPMSNNGDVRYSGDSFFFTYEDTQKIRDIESSPQVCLNYEGESGLFISIRGRAKVIRRKSMFEQHWQEELTRWFPEGIETEGMVMVHVKGSSIQYW